jgi:prepilin peptidase CpaA
LLQIELVQPLAIAVLAVSAAWSDLRSRTIPNWLCLLTACLGILSAAIFSGWQPALWHVAHMLLALAIGMVLFGLHWWGGGDSKFYAAVAAWVPLSGFFALLVWIALAGLVLVAGAYLLRRLKAPEERRSLDSLPYGVAISAGILCTVLRTFLTT